MDRELPELCEGITYTVETDKYGFVTYTGKNGHIVRVAPNGGILDTVKGWWSSFTTHFQENKNTYVSVIGAVGAISCFKRCYSLLLSVYRVEIEFMDSNRVYKYINFLRKD